MVFLYQFWYKKLPPAAQVTPEGGVPAEEEAYAGEAFPWLRQRNPTRLRLIGSEQQVPL